LIKTKRVQARKLDVGYNYESKIESKKKSLKKILSPSDYRLVEKYDTVMVVGSLKLATRTKNLEIILSLSRMLSKKSWIALTRDDINHLVSVVMMSYSSNGEETNTTYDHKKILKIFFRWLKLGSREKNVVGDPPEVQDVKCKQVADKLVRESLITSEDLKKMLEHCFTLRDKAFIHVHYESGTRAGDILSLQIKHVSSDKYGMKIAVDGKTGARPIRLVESVPSLAKYLEGHPFNDDPESPLWINLGNQDYGEPLQYAAANKLLKAAARRAGIKKRVYLHLFRHSAATRGVSYMGESIMRKRYGWSATSKMPSKYAHITQEDVESAVLGHYGIKQDSKTEARVPKICPICTNPNAFDSDMCDRCGKPLTVEKAILLETESQQEKNDMESRLGKMEVMLQQVFSQTMKEPEALKALEDVLRKR